MRTLRICPPSDFPMYHAAVLAAVIILYITSPFTFTNDALISEFVDTWLGTFYYYLFEFLN